MPYEGGPGRSMGSVVQGLSFPAFLWLSAGAPPGNFTLYWGDGTTSTQMINQSGVTPPFTHVFSDLGTFVLLGAATIRNYTYFGNTTLVPLRAGPPVPPSISQIYPGLSATFTNGSSGVFDYNPWIHVGQSINLSAVYTSLPTFPGYDPRPPTLQASPGAVRTGGSNTSVSVTATYSFASPGMYWITMVGAISDPWGTIYQNYTWSVYVGAAGVPLGCGGCEGTYS